MKEILKLIEEDLKTKASFKTVGNIIFDAKRYDPNIQYSEYDGLNIESFIKLYLINSMYENKQLSETEKSFLTKTLYEEIETKRLIGEQCFLKMKCPHYESEIVNIYYENLERCRKIFEYFGLNDISLEFILDATAEVINIKRRKL